MKTFILLLSLALIPAIGHADYDQSYSSQSYYSSGAVYGQEKPLAVVGSNVHSASYSVPQDYTKVLVSSARVTHTDIKPMDESLRKELNGLNQKLMLVGKQLDDIQKNQAHEVTGTVSVAQ